jgi:serine/threonine protein kinase
VADFRFGDRIGSGGFGVVRHATRVEDGLPFAVKHLLDEHTDDDDVVERFRREVRIQRGLERPNVLSIVGANLSASPPWFVMPIAERTLADEISDGLDNERVIAIFRGVLAGFSYSHGEGVIHRDLKPENVMMSHDGTPMVSDWGLGKNLLSNSTALTTAQRAEERYPNDPVVADAFPESSTVFSVCTTTTLAVPLDSLFLSALEG